jgi:hypothetical protein
LNPRLIYLDLCVRDNVMRKLSVTLLLIIALMETLSAQNFYSKRRDRTLMFSYGAGISTYHGDMYDILYDGLSPGPNVGLGLRKKLGSQLSMRLDVNWYQISAADSLTGASGTLGRSRGRTISTDSREIRNLSFRARNFELSAQFIFNLIPIKGSYSRRPLINPYIIAGLGISTNNPKGLDSTGSGEWVNLRELNTEVLSEPYSGVVMVVPFGFGLRLRANQFIDILVEGARRFTFSDHLDDVSSDYPSIDQVRQYHIDNGTGLEELAVRMYDRSAEAGFAPRKERNTRGNPEYNDAYYIFQLRLEMYLPDNFLGEIFSPSRKKPKFR